MTPETIKFFSSSDGGPNDPEEKKRLQSILSLSGKIESRGVHSAAGPSCSRLLDNFLKFIQLKKGEQIKELLSDSGCGLLLLCSCIPEMKAHFPIMDLEFDCRGDIEQLISTDGSTDNITYIISAGEIKSSAAGIPKAKSQLSRRLTVMKEALKLMPHYKDTATTKIVLKGVIFLPASESKEMTGKNTTLPSSTEYSLQIVFC